MSIYLTGVGARFYRGIGPKEQLISPFSKINLFIGANNSGKSIILCLINDVCPEYIKNNKIKVLPTDQYLGAETGTAQVFLASEKEVIVKKCLDEVSIKIPNKESVQYKDIESDINKLVDCLSHGGFIWYHKKNGENKPELFPEADIDSISGAIQGWSAIWNILLNSSGGSLRQHWVPKTIQKISALAVNSLPQVHMIPAKRQLGAKGESFNDLSGKGLIDHLASLQNPSFDRQEDREKFKKINEFIQDITGKPDAQLEVPSEREHLLVHLDNKVLPLSSLGTGIHEVILIAAFCTIHDSIVMCIEEPEIHLHPILQKKLVNYLAEKTNNQYFIATHSSSFLDSPRSSVFHVSNDGSQTYVRDAITKDRQRILLDELGYKASDILQSNAVIWVEGPSDRIYVKHWINAYDKNLKEGVHFTIMFYGGALIRSC